MERISRQSLYSPHLWNHGALLTAARELAKAGFRAGQPLSVEFLDLERLSRHLPGDDEMLEALLYGHPQGRAVLSGWTQGRWEEFCKAAGLATEANPDDKPLTPYRRVLCSPTERTNSQLGAMARAWWHQQIWFFRKSLRLKWQEMKSRISHFDDLGALGSQPSLQINLGAGQEDYPGWIKIDWAGPQHIFDNIVTLKSLRPCSVDKIYCNHVLEHIPSGLLPEMLARWRDILKPKGGLWIRVPDARQALVHWKKPWSEANPAELKTWGFPPVLEREEQSGGILNEQDAIQWIYGWSDANPHIWTASNQHKSLWTPRLTQQRLEAAGFRVELCVPSGSLNTVAVARRGA